MLLTVELCLLINRSGPEGPLMKNKLCCVKVHVYWCACTCAYTGHLLVIARVSVLIVMVLIVARILNTALA